MADIVLTGDTSGAITIAAPDVSGTNTLTLPASTGTLLTTTGDGSGLTGLVRSQMPTGSVLQVVSSTTTAYNNTTGSTYIDSGITTSITPNFATSEILVFVNINGTRKTNNTALRLQLVRVSTVLSIYETIAGYTNTTTTNSVGSSAISYLDSPSTTSSTVYKVQFSSSSGATVELNAGAASSITLMEIAA